MFKFNTFRDVIAFYETINSTSYDYGKLETLLNSIHAMTDDITTINEWAELRNLIVRGFPNGYPYSGEHCEIFNILSKQP